MSIEDEIHNRKLGDIFLDGWDLYEFIEHTTIPTNSIEFQRKVKQNMEQFELATTIVSQIDMFSSNEHIEEVPTESLQYLLLPYFLGKLALQRIQEDRADVLRIARIYFCDFLQRCHKYELCGAPKSETLDEKLGEGCIDTPQQLIASSVTRNNKIAQYKKRKDLEKQIKEMKIAIKNKTADDEFKRNFYIKCINRNIIDANEELQNIELEKGVVEMRKHRMAEFGTTKMDDFALPPANVDSDVDTQRFHSHGHEHSNSRGTRHMYLPPKPKAMKPFIITKNDAQKAVFGLGYPSLPVMTVSEFYQQRVEDGIFPDAEKMAHINEQKALDAAQNPEIQEEEEKVKIEEQIETDDPEYIERMRGIDEYKDVVRRGDGNRHNRS